MLLIQPIQDKTLQAGLCRLCGTKYRPEMLAYFSADGDDETFEPVRFTGLCQFSPGGQFADLRSLPGTDDTEALQIMARTAMNFLYRCGCPSAQLLPDAVQPALVEKLGFRRSEDGMLSIDLVKFYQSPCHYGSTPEAHT